MLPEARITLIAALSEKDRVIGKDGKIPWRISTDLKRFKELTSGNTVVMGRRTYESIGKPLPDRVNIVITRDKGFTAHGCTVVHSLEEALVFANEHGSGNVYVIGGGQVYDQAISRASRLDLTIVKGEFEGDTFFPDYSDFHLTSREEREEKGQKFEFTTFERKGLAVGIGRR